MNYVKRHEKRAGHVAIEEPWLATCFRHRHRNRINTTNARVIADFRVPADLLVALNARNVLVVWLEQASRILSPYALYYEDSALGRPTIGKTRSAREYSLRCERSPPYSARIWGVTRCAFCSVPIN